MVLVRIWTYIHPQDSISHRGQTLQVDIFPHLDCTHSYNIFVHMHNQLDQLLFIEIKWIKLIFT